MKMEKRRRKTTQKNYLIMLCDGRGNFWSCTVILPELHFTFSFGKIAGGEGIKNGVRDERSWFVFRYPSHYPFTWLSLPTGVITHCWDGNLQFNQINSRSQIPFLSTTIPQNSEREVSAGDR